MVISRGNHPAAFCHPATNTAVLQVQCLQAALCSPISGQINEPEMLAAQLCIGFDGGAVAAGLLAAGCWHHAGDRRRCCWGSSRLCWWRVAVPSGPHVLPPHLPSLLIRKTFLPLTTITCYSLMQLC